MKSNLKYTSLCCAGFRFTTDDIKIIFSYSEWLSNINIPNRIFCMDYKQSNTNPTPNAVFLFWKFALATFITRFRECEVSEYLTHTHTHVIPKRRVSTSQKGKIERTKHRPAESCLCRRYTQMFDMLPHDSTATSEFHQKASGLCFYRNELMFLALLHVLHKGNIPMWRKRPSVRPLVSAFKMLDILI
jgi:hypothetical protein